MKNTERRIEIPGLEVALKSWGPPDGRRVMALHGWLDNAGSFDGLIPELGDGFRVAALDLPGHGRSAWRSDADAYYFADWVGVVLQVADELGWEEFSLLGHSMGGAIASMVAPVAPDRVERMVFLDALGPMSTPADDAVDQLASALREEKGLRRRAPRRYASRDEMADALRRSRGDLDRDPLGRLLDRVARRTDDGAWYFGHDPRLKASSRVRLTESQVLAFLEEIDVPVRLIRPRRGWPVEESAMQRRLRAVEAIDVVEAKGGHHVHLQAPERVAGPVREFLAGESD